jgi:hypothetical protein
MDKMSQSSNPLKQNLDDRLANFTDDVLEGRKQDSISGMEEELLQLEKTVLSMRTAFPPINMDEARIKQMQVRLKNRIKREQEEASLPFWQKLFSTPQHAMMVGVVSLLIVFLLVSPSVTVPTGSSTTATAINPAIGPLAAGGLVAVIIIILWIKRRK